MLSPSAYPLPPETTLVCQLVHTAGRRWPQQSYSVEGGDQAGLELLIRISREMVWLVSVAAQLPTPPSHCCSQVGELILEKGRHSQSCLPKKAEMIFPTVISPDTTVYSCLWTEKYGIIPKQLGPDPSVPSN